MNRVNISVGIFCFGVAIWEISQGNLIIVLIDLGLAAWNFFIGLEKEGD